jgi:hypothetical protein
VFIRAILLVAILLCGSNVLFEDADFWRVSDKDRKYYLTKGQVWHQTDIGSTDVYAGPSGEIAIPPETEVACKYVEPRIRSTGHSPKFKCKLPKNNETVRIKFGSKEANAEVAGTRLLWALGFYSDKNYPVRLKCLGCPGKNPSKPSSDEARLDRLLEDTVLEENFEGKEIGVYPDQGWNWQEIELVDEKIGGASRAEIDALKLLAVFMQHTDSKHEQQRLACYPEDMNYWGKEIVCERPVLMIQDLGETFGKGGEEITDESAMNFGAWSKQDIWNESKEAEFSAKNQGARVCIGNLTSAEFAEGDGLSDPIISEDGRQFASNLLNQLSDHQIADLFRAARVEKLNQTIEEQGNKRTVMIEDWVEAFKKKQQQIAERRCR